MQEKSGGCNKENSFRSSEGGCNKECGEKRIAGGEKTNHGVHNEIYPQQRNRRQRQLAFRSGRDKVEQDSDNIDDQLKLQKLADTLVYLVEWRMDS